MTPITIKPIPKLRKASQPPLSHPGAIPDSDRAKRPPLSEPSATGEELTPGDRVEGLGNFGEPTGEFGTVERADEEDAVVKWDDDSRMRIHQPSLKEDLDVRSLSFASVISTIGETRCPTESSFASISESGPTQRKAA
jgi:hypothetical protein